jgi:ribosomal protein L44E
MKNVNADHRKQGNKNQPIGDKEKILFRMWVVIVCYHCGGWHEEVNSCVLNSYMVYL